MTGEHIELTGDAAKTAKQRANPSTEQEAFWGVFALRSTEARMHAKSRFFRTSKGTSVHYLESGPSEAAPVILLHGCGSFAEEVLLPFRDTSHRLIALDRPGYGYSDSLDGPELGPLGQSFWLEDVLEGLKITGAVVVAHSIGSAIAVHLAARRPDLARRLLLLSPCCSPIYDKPMLDLRIATAPIVGTFISRHVLSRCAALLARKGLTASAFPNEVPTELAALAPERFVNSSAIVTMANEARLFNRDMAILSRVPSDLELRVIFGSGDRIIKPARHIEWLRRVHGHPTVRVLEGVGHLPHHSVPGIALEALQELVSCQAMADPALQHPRAVA